MHREDPGTERAAAIRPVRPLRRWTLLRAGVAGLAAPVALAGCDDRPETALVYRGPAACDGCAEAVTALLRSAAPHLKVVYCGPRERVPLSARTLAGAAVYAHPGGGDLAPAWRAMRGHAADLRAFVRGGGRYLGFCLGAYLAGRDPGYGLLPGDTDQYVTSPGASVHDTRDTVVAVRWRGKPRHVYFQDGPLFTFTGPATVLATYATAAVCRYGAGRVGVVGPHPEADASWYADAGITNPDGVRLDLGRDFVTTTLS
jgi:hypothetical protein